MSRYYKIIFQVLICLNLVSCSLVPDELKTAEQVMETAPDSALHILQSIKQSRLIAPSNKALYALLMSQALDKNDIKVESDSLILIATKYYSKNDPIHAGYAWFYMARCANNRGNANVQADALLKAQEFAEKTEDYKLLGLVNVEKSDLYAAQGETDSVIVYRKLSYHAFKKIDNKYNCIVDLLNIGHVYLNTQQLDSAIVYYFLAENLSKLLNDTILNSTVYRSLAMVYNQKGDNKMALYYLNHAPLTHISIYNSNISYLKARIFIETGKSDSARYYLNKVKELREMAPDYYHLWQTLYEKEGNFKKAIYFANKITEVKDSLNQSKLSVSFAGMEKKYKYQNLQVSNQKLIIKNKENKILLLIGLIVISLFLIITLLWRYSVKKQELEVQKQLVEKEKENNQLLDKQLKMQNILLLNVEQYRNHSIKRPINSYEKQHVISPILNLTFHEELIASMDIQYYDISKRLFERFSDLTERDILICCLLLAGFETGMMATILDIKIESITKHRYRLRTKLEMQNSDNLIDYLRDF